MKHDYREPIFEKIGCYCCSGDGSRSFSLFDEREIKDGDVFVYSKGILFRIQPKVK